MNHYLSVKLTILSPTVVRNTVVELSYNYYKDFLMGNYHK